MSRILPRCLSNRTQFYQRTRGAKPQASLETCTLIIRESCDLGLGGDVFYLSYGTDFVASEDPRLKHVKTQGPSGSPICSSMGLAYPKEPLWVKPAPGFINPGLSDDGDVSSELVSWKSEILFLIVFNLSWCSLSILKISKQAETLWISLEIYSSISCDTTCPACLTKFSWSKQPQSGHVSSSRKPKKRPSRDERPRIGGSVAGDVLGWDQGC